MRRFKVCSGLGFTQLLLTTFVCREGDVAPTFHPEFGRFMLEATPGKPWGIGFKDLLSVERDMKRRSVLSLSL